MRWRGRDESTNVEDRRGMSPRMVAGGGIGALLLAVLISQLTGIDISSILGPSAGTAPSSTQSTQYQPSQAEQDVTSFVKGILRSNEKIWGQKFQREGKSYHNPQMVLYSAQVTSACGMANAGMGPFYCPGDQKLYLDLSALGNMERQLKSNVSFKKAGDSALAYIVSHEFGHHIQTLMEISDWLNTQRHRLDTASFNQWQVRFELQADCLAGIWAHEDQKLHPERWEERDIPEAIKVAKVVGDDRIQSELQGRVRPDTFTHGTSEQRVGWFYEGYRSGNLDKCDTFHLPDPRF